MTPKKPINPFAAITDTPLSPSNPPPPPSAAEVRREERHREYTGWSANHSRWLENICAVLHTVKWLLIALLLVNLTTCIATCSSREITWRQTR